MPHLTYDEFRFVWFFLLSFASFMLGGRLYGLIVTVAVLGIVYLQFFTTDLHLSNIAIFTFTTSLLTSTIFFLLFLHKVENDALIIQKYLAQEKRKRKTKEQLLQQIHKKDIIYFDNDYLWDNRRKILTHEGKTIKLTQKEKRLLSLLIEHKNHCVSFEDIQANVWIENYEDDISIQSVKLQITNLRKKLPKGCISNVYGAGYVLLI